MKRETLYSPLRFSPNPNLDSLRSSQTWNLSEARTKHLAALEKITGLSAPSPAQISFDRDVPTFFNVLSKSKRKKGSTFWNDRRGEGERGAK